MSTKINDDDLEIDDLIDNLNKKKKIKSKSKGKRGEALIVKLLNSRFSERIKNHPTGGGFSRSVASGARWGQNANLSQTSLGVFSGDVSVPTGFIFTIEIKNGYNDVDLFNCFDKGCAELDEFLKQATNDGNRSGRKPILMWRKDRKETIAFFKEGDFLINTETVLYYKGWVGVNLNYLLTFDDACFFN